jgi:hypothetical protein
MSTRIQRFRYAILFAALLLLTGVWSAYSKQISTGGQCVRGEPCNIGNDAVTELTLTTANAVLGVDQSDNELTFIASGTNTATFIGADAAGAANTTYDTTGAGAVTLGSADVTTLSLTNNGVMNVGAATTNSVTINGATSITMVTDEGTVTIDGYVQADLGPFITLASGTLTANTIHLATAQATYTIPTCVAANIGEWVTVIAQDVNEVLTLDLADASNTISMAGAIVATGDEIDSEGHATTGDGEFITLTCVVAEIWYSTAIGGVWIDGAGN